DVVTPGSTFYYWIRFININDIAGPYNDVDGTKVSTSPNISDIINDIGDQMKESVLIQDLNKGIEGVAAAVQENTQVIEEINSDGSKAYQSMWSVKAQAGDIKAGIGILADSNGKSQVAIAASQFFVFDPNVEGGATQPLFA
ncbi:phage tail tip fiber protein, partial [Photobacterium damselae]|uniref:phage tail tip fiber protein n=1 Tax=Photobacterium damselae TaxID=38293 RepID=UPI0040675E7D